MLLGPDWDRIRAAGGGWELELQRARSDALVDAVASSTSFDELKERVERMESQIQAVETAATSPPSRGKFPNIWDYLTRGEAGRWPVINRPVTGHGIVGTDRVELQLLMPASNALYQASCAVTDPLDVVRHADAVQVRSIVPGTATYRVSYPQDFKDGAELIPGRYEAQWRLRPISPTLMTPPVDIAVHRFTIEGSEAEAEASAPR
jgi:hypothetical protein